MAAAELGSFSRAATRLSVSTPALVKQVSGFEAEYGVSVFERSHVGVRLTAAGGVLVEDARSVVPQCEDALRRARGAQEAGDAVRMGVSLMSPGRFTLDRWSRMSAMEPDLCLELVLVGSLYDERASVMDRLGQEVDVIQTSFSTLRWEGQCNLLPLFDAPFYLDVPRTNPLAGRDAVGLSDLMGQRVRILRHAHDDMDRLREALMANEGVHVADVEAFDIELFNDSMEKGNCVLTTGAWSGVHRALLACRFAGRRPRATWRTRCSQNHRSGGLWTPWRGAWGRGASRQAGRTLPRGATERADRPSAGRLRCRPCRRFPPA